MRNDNEVIQKLKQLLGKRIPAFQKGVAKGGGIGREIDVVVNGKTVKALSYNVNSPGEVNVFYDTTNKRYVVWTEEQDNFRKQVLYLRKSRDTDLPQLESPFLVSLIFQNKIHIFGNGSNLILQNNDIPININAFSKTDTDTSYVIITETNVRDYRYYKNSTTPLYQFNNVEIEPGNELFLDSMQYPITVAVEEEPGGTPSNYVDAYPVGNNSNPNLGDLRNSLSYTINVDYTNGGYDRRLATINDNTQTNTNGDILTTTQVTDRVMTVEMKTLSHLKVHVLCSVGYSEPTSVVYDYNEQGDSSYYNYEQTIVNTQTGNTINNIDETEASANITGNLASSSLIYIGSTKTILTSGTTGSTSINHTETFTGNGDENDTYVYERDMDFSYTSTLTKGRFYQVLFNSEVVTIYTETDPLTETTTSASELYESGTITQWNDAGIKVSKNTYTTNYSIGDGAAGNKKLIIQTKKNKTTVSGQTPYLFAQATLNTITPSLNLTSDFNYYLGHNGNFHGIETLIFSTNEVYENVPPSLTPNNKTTDVTVSSPNPLYYSSLNGVLVDIYHARDIYNNQVDVYSGVLHLNMDGYTLTCTTEYIETIPYFYFPKYTQANPVFNTVFIQKDNYLAYILYILRIESVYYDLFFRNQKVEIANVSISLKTVVENGIEYERVYFHIVEKHTPYKNVNQNYKDWYVTQFYFDPKTKTVKKDEFKSYPIIRSKNVELTQLDPIYLKYISYRISFYPPK